MCLTRQLIVAAHVYADDKRLIPGFEQFFESKSLSTSTNVPLLWLGVLLACPASLLVGGTTGTQTIAVGRCGGGA